jgi:hypothetical protein
MNNIQTTNTEADNKIQIKEVSADTMTLIVNGEEHKINYQLPDLKELMKTQHITYVTYENKVYNIEHINEANFGVMVSNKIFNGILTRELILLLKENKNVELFLSNLPPDDMDDWEGKRQHLREAQGILEDSFVWVIGWELRRLFSIGNDREKKLETKIDEYVNHCFSTYRISLQLINYLFIAKLWDEKIGNRKIDTDKIPIRNFFFSNRSLELAELRKLFQVLLEIFRDNQLKYPIDEKDLGDINEFIQSDSKFNKSCSELERLADMDMESETYGLGHCHTAEISLTAILIRFKFFTCYQLVTLRKIEYEAARNCAARFIKDLNILEKNEDKHLLRYLKYDINPAYTYSVFFRNKNTSVNLFPFVLDYNALTDELDFQIFFYQCRESESELCYFSIQSENEETIPYTATSTESMEIRSEEQKNEVQRNIRLDLVVKQFEEAMNTTLGTKFSFKPKEDDLHADNLSNI